MEKAISDKFRWWVFISILLIVFLHGYNLQQRFLQPWTIVREPFTPTGFAEYFVANGLLRFLIPMLFAISGFLYALHDSAPNVKRIPRRIRGLLLPYLIWSTFAMAMTYIMEMFPYARHLVFTSGIAYVDDQRRLLHDYRWYELLRSWLLSTIAYQLWFLRVLFFYNLIYPVIRWCILHKILRWPFWMLVLMLWITTFESVILDGEGLLFFSLGIWLQKTNVNISTTARSRRNSLAWACLFLLSATAMTWLAFRGQAILGNRVYPVVVWLHKLTVASGFITGWFGLDGLIRWSMCNSRLAGLTAFSFFIYAFHTPLLAYAINPFLDWLHPFAAFRLLAFILLPLTVIALCIGLGTLLRHVAPDVYKVLTGGRGIG